MKIYGPDFVALQVVDLEAAAEFYTDVLGLARAPQNPPHAIVFDTKPIPLAVREPLPGVELEQVEPHPGAGVALWLLCDDTAAAHATLVEHGVPVVAEPKQSPFGLTITFRDPSGYLITLHDKA